MEKGEVERPLKNETEDKVKEQRHESPLKQIEIRQLLSHDLQLLTKSKRIVNEIRSIKFFKSENYDLLS